MAAIVISKRWDGAASSTRAVVVTFALEKSGDISILIDAPFHSDPIPPAPVGEYFELHRHEMIQVFVGIGEFPSGASPNYDNVQYLEVAVGPHGHYYARMFSGEGNFSSCDSSLQFPRPSVLINANEDCWNAEVRIPLDYIPEPAYISSQNAFKWMINASAHHGGHGDASREVMALSPVPGSEINFHQLSTFVPILLRPDAASGSNNSGTVFRVRAGSSNQVNLNEVDGDSLSEAESDPGDEERDSMAGPDNDSANMRMYRILSGIAEERDEDLRSTAAPRTSNSAHISGVRVPSKDWYTINREFDPNAPPTLASYTEQYRGTVKLPTKYHRYMNDDEFAIISALIWKRKGWSHKERVLILTSKPRLLYLDENGKYKGTIPWSPQQQVGAVKVSATQFDISTGTNKRVYHFTDKPNGSEKWVEVINKMVSVWSTSLDYETKKQRNNNASSTTTPQNISAGISASPVPADSSSAGTARVRSGSSHGSGAAASPAVGTTPQASQNSSSAIVPLTVSELLEKYRRPQGVMDPHEKLKFLSGIPLKDEAKFLKNIHADEFVILQGYVHKAQGFLPKRRVLILTSKPRLLYFKRDGTFVGTIAWSMTTPISVKKVSGEGFDITEANGKDVYHFSDKRGGADRWVTIIQEIIDGWAAYLKWQVGKVKPVGKQTHTRT